MNSELDQIKTSCEILWGVAFGELHFTSSSGWLAIDFHSCCACKAAASFPVYSESMEWLIGLVKKPQNLLFLSRFNGFSWINIFCIFPCLWLISRFLKKLNDNTANILCFICRNEFLKFFTLLFWAFFSLAFFSPKQVFHNLSLPSLPKLPHHHISLPITDNCITLDKIEGISYFLAATLWINLCQYLTYLSFLV